VAVYIREAHPTDGWRSTGNDRVGISFLQPRSKLERKVIATKCCSTLQITMPMVVDEMNDLVGHLYSGMPDRLYIIDRDGRVAYKGGRGPFGFKTGEMEQSLMMLLLEQQQPGHGPVVLQGTSLPPGVGPAASAANVPLLNDAEAWAHLPPVEEGLGQPLPVWARALAASLPRTTGAMIDLDYAQRVESSLPQQLRAKLRWIAADANRCAYTRAYARADYLRAGGSAAELDDLLRRLDRLPEAERLALAFVRQLVEAAYTATDSQVARLVQIYGEKQVVAMVLIAAYANFQDRLMLALGVSVEPNGPLPPVKVRFRTPPQRTRRSDETETPAEKTPKRKQSPPAKNPPSVPLRVDDPEWTAISFEALRERLKHQSAREARVSIPDVNTVRHNIPEGIPQPDDREMRIRWSRLNYGYQARLTTAWFAALDAFFEESDLDGVFHESMFWVVTRSLQCFY
jgi:hypothetical protein